MGTVSEMIGPLAGPVTVTRAAIAAYKEWLPTYLAEVERQNDLPNKKLGRPANEKCYYAGIDFESVGPGSEVPAEPPVVIFTAKPDGAPEMTTEGYFQAYELTVACILMGATEEEAYEHAGMWGEASMLLSQVGSLGGLSERTVMAGAPDIQFVDPENAQRRLMRSVVTYTVHVPSIISQAGPWGQTLAETPEIPEGEPEAAPGERPLVTKTNLTIDAEDV